MGYDVALWFWGIVIGSSVAILGAVALMGMVSKQNDEEDMLAEELGIKIDNLYAGISE